MTVSASLLALLAACSPAQKSGTAASGGDDTGPAPQVSGVDWRLDDVVQSFVRVSWTQDASAVAAVHFRVPGEEWHATPSEQREAGLQEQVLMGMPYDSDVEFQVVLDDGVTESEVESARTGGLSLDDLQPELLSADPTRWEPTGNYLLTSMNGTRAGWSSGDYYVLILDRQARVVWAWPVPDSNFSLYARPSRDGNDLLWDEITFWTDWDGGDASEVHRMRLDGTMVESYPVPGANHAFAELPDGTIAWHAMDGNAVAAGSARLRVLRTDGEVQTVWDCDELYDTLSMPSGCLSNTVFYDEDRDTFLTSFAMSDLVLELDHQTGDVVRAFGDVDGGYGFDPPEAAFHVQHGVTWTDTGTLLLSTHLDAGSDEVVVREYEVDDEAKLLRQVWTYGEGEGVYASLGGDALRLPGGDTLHSYGVNPRIKEITPDGAVVWDVTWPENRMIGSTLWLEDLYSFAY